MKAIPHHCRWRSLSTKAAQIIDGTAIAATIRSEITSQAAALTARTGIVPGIATLLVGHRADSMAYVNAKGKAAKSCGLHSVQVTLNQSASTQEVLEAVRRLNADPLIHAILVQLPLPPHVDPSVVLNAVKVEKDVDGFSAENIGRLCLKRGKPFAIPCTPLGCIELLRRSNIAIAGQKAVVLGRSDIVGMPLANLLIHQDATVTVCHSRTRNLQDEIRQADILVAAIGKAEMVRGDWLKPGCTVIDVGINPIPDPSRPNGHRLVGDVHYESARLVASHITPVPGGVGPMTIAMLLQNTLNLATMSVAK